MKDETLKRKQKLKLDSEQTALLAAIWRTEANITITERSLANLKQKHHQQCAEYVAQVSRLSVANPTGKMPVQQGAQ